MRETHYWLISLACTVVILVILAGHFAVMHFSPTFSGMAVEQARGWVQMMARGGQVAWLLAYVVFLAAALYHGLYGLRGILLEIPAIDRWRRPVTWLLVIIGVLFFAYGTYVTWWTFASA